MDELEEKSALKELLPINIGSARVTEVSLGKMYLLLPFQGQQEKLSAMLQAQRGFSLPAPNQSVAKGNTRVIWFGRASYLLTGVEAPPNVSSMAAVTEQTDAWATVEVAGTGVEDILARLVPLDLRLQSFGHNATRRTIVGHMNASITRTEEGSLLIMVFRSMAETLCEELKEAMEAVAARG